ncbi:hypothetical protein IFO70_03665 [Phormidium tenue FACHB-886]|nr:hypothetical protein [Phormidium tenue FACHB-886]
MLTVDALVQFSCSYCITICAVLVPANLLATLQTMLLVWYRRPLAKVQLTATAASLFALLLLLHVLAWLSIGVVMAPTYILAFLGCLCVMTNLGCVAIAAQRCSNLMKAG